MLVLRQAVAFINEQLVGFGENILVADDLAQLINQLIVFLELLRTSGHWKLFLTGACDDTPRAARMEEMSVPESGMRPDRIYEARLR